MIEKIKELKKYDVQRVPVNESERTQNAQIQAYNQAIEDVVKLFSIHTVITSANNVDMEAYYKVLDKMAKDYE